MVRNLGGPADGAEEDRVMAADLLLPVLRHHAAMLFVVLGIGEIEPVEPQCEAITLRRLFQGAHAFRHHFLADAVAGDDGNAIGLRHSSSLVHRRDIRRTADAEPTRSAIAGNDSSPDGH